MTFLLDANTCIKYLNGRSVRVRQRLESVSPGDVVLCSIVKAELFYGAMKSSRIAENLSRAETFAGRFVSLPFDDGAAAVYGDGMWRTLALLQSLPSPRKSSSLRALRDELGVG